MSSPAHARALWALTFAVALSQFYRACLAVIAPELQQDLGLSPAAFGTLSACFFFAFAVAQIPVGMAFDRWGVGAPTRWSLLLGVLSALVFALAPSGPSVMLAQVGLGLACAPVFMGLMHYASEHLPASRYASFVGRANAIALLGGLLATAPLGWAAQLVGWRWALLAAALLMALACLAVWRWVRDQGHAEVQQETALDMLAICARLLLRPAMWAFIPMCLILAAGSNFRSAWGGPYFSDVFGLGPGARGMALTVLTLGAFVTALALPMAVQRYTIKVVVLGWLLATGVAGLVLSVWPAFALWPNVALLTLLGTLGILQPIVMAHARELLPPAMRGRGLGVLNTFVFAGWASSAAAFGWVAELGQRDQLPAATSYGRIFLLASALIAVGALSYVFSARAPSDRERSASGL